METGKRDPKGRLLKRLAVLAVRHAGVVSLVCSVAGIIALVLLPVLAKSVYVDENALLPGSARATFTHSDAVSAHELAEEVQALVTGSIDAHKDFREWFAAHMNAVGADYYFQRFCPPTRSFSVSAFSTSSFTHGSGRRCESEQIPGVNAVGIVRAAQGEGNEAIVLVTPYQVEQLTPEAAETIGLTLALLRLLSRSPWLAKDILWLAAESKYGEYTGVAAWLKEYYEPSNVRDVELDDGTFKRAGSIAAAFVLELNSSSVPWKQNDMEVRVEGSNGQMPNMDMISIVNLLVSWRQNFQMKRERMEVVAGWPWLSSLGSVVELVGRRVADFRRAFLTHSRASFVTEEDYINRISTLARSCWDQMLGIPTGSHGAFRDYQVDAVTLHVTCHRIGKVDLVLDLGRLVEGVLLSVNNLLEKFHQSLFLYLMVSPDKFVSISTYIIPFALLLVSFPIQAASLCSGFKSGRLGSWIHAIVLVLVVEIWSLASAFLPVVIWPLFDSASARVASWCCISETGFILAVLIVTLFVQSPRTSDDWFIPLKALMLGLTGIALGIFSAVNFSVALIGSLLALPMCLLVQPLSVSSKFLLEAHGTFGRVKVILSTVLAFFLTLLPLLVLFLIVASVQDPFSLSGGVETLWFWGSAFYLSIFIVHLPCFMICLYITFA